VLRRAVPHAVLRHLGNSGLHHPHCYRFHHLRRCGAQSVRGSLEHCRQHCYRVDRDVAGLGAHGRALLRCGQAFFTLVVVLIPKAIGA
jgi:hypothetical protein